MKVVVISGGSSGIGKECVKKFLDNNYCVYNLDIQPDTNTHDNFKWIDTDVTNHASIKAAIAEIITRSHKIDITIISAGKHLSANIENTTDGELEDILNINLKGAFWLIQEVIQHMKTAKSGNIITIGSDQSSVAKSNSTVYGMSKSALLSLTKSVAIDYAKYNIRANCVGAGTIDTPLYQTAIANYSVKSGIPIEQIQQEEADCQPVGRVGSAMEVAELVYFLSQDVAKYMTGALIPFDGGYIETIK